MIANSNKPQAVPNKLAELERFTKEMAKVDVNLAIKERGKTKSREAAKKALHELTKADIPTAITKQLVAFYNSKCAYCDAQADDFELEHYRPKGRVSEDPRHLGYYWLRYEWTNLLPACQTCNGTKRKGNHFPLASEDARVYKPLLTAANELDGASCKYNHPYLEQEKPLLLHPEFEDPEKHLVYDTLGKLMPASGSEKGRATIGVLGLNRRALRNNRTKWVLDLTRTLELGINLAYAKNKIPDTVILETVTEQQFDEFVTYLANPENPFMGYARYLFNNFQEMFISLIADPEALTVIAHKWNSLKGKGTV